MLDSIEQMDPYYRARVSDASDRVDPGDAQEIAALDGRLRDLARRFVHALPDHKIADRAQALEFLDQTKDIGRVADMAMAHSGLPVSESAAYAQETQLARRLERAIAALDAALAREIAAAPPT